MPVLFMGQAGAGRGAAEWAVHQLPQAEGNKPEDFEPADSSREKMKEDEEGRLQSRSYSWFPAWDTLPAAATSQKHESNFGGCPEAQGR